MLVARREQEYHDAGRTDGTVRWINSIASFSRRANTAVRTMKTTLKIFIPQQMT
jgi:hypothetical protein